MDTTILPIKGEKTYLVVYKALLDGEVISFPTDTVYGIGCALFNPDAIERIYKIKERSTVKAIPVLIGNFEQLKAVSSCISLNAHYLTKAFWPGALTVIVNKSRQIPKTLSSGSSVGVRMPNHNWLRNLITQVGPLAVTSANLSGKKDSQNAQEVLHQLKNRIKYIVDGGSCDKGIPSTVVDCTQENIQILRQGAILVDQINAVIQAQI